MSRVVQVNEPSDIKKSQSQAVAMDKDWGIREGPALHWSGQQWTRTAKVFRMGTIPFWEGDSHPQTKMVSGTVSRLVTNRITTNLSTPRTVNNNRSLARTGAEYKTYTCNQL